MLLVYRSMVAIEVSKSMRIQCCEVEYPDNSDSLVDISPPVSLPTFNFNELGFTARCDEKMNIPPDDDIDEEFIDPPIMDIAPPSATVHVFSQNIVTQPPLP